MHKQKRFSEYLLFKQISEDELGTSYRAGRVRQRWIDRVVLLRVFDGNGIAGERFWHAVSASRLPTITHANVGASVDAGLAEGRPYVAYEYQPGWSLAELLRRTRARPVAVPLEQSLAIADGVARGLAAAAETDREAFHGLLHPGLINLSAEGSLTTLGFEVAAGLRDLTRYDGPHRRGLDRYLAPEVRAGSKPRPIDDVYSLGALLYELLTGDRPPRVILEHEVSEALSSATLSGNESGIPEAHRDLLRRSLVPREWRLETVKHWRDRLAHLVAECGGGPSTFNLAFFLHSTFRQEIESEAAELATEQATVLPERAIELFSGTPEGSVHPAPGDGDGDDPRFEPSEPPAETPLVDATAPAAQRRWQPPVIAVLSLAVLTAGVAGIRFFSNTTPAAGARQAPSPAAEAVEKEGEAELTPDQLQAEVQRLVAARADTLEADLRASYDARLQQLRNRVVEARLRSVQRQTERRRAEQQAQRALPAVDTGQQAAVAAEDTPAGDRPAVGSTTPPASTTDAAPQPVADPPPAAADDDEAEERAAEPLFVGAVEPASQARAPLPVDESPLAATAPPAETEAPRLRRPPQPVYPPAARRFNRQATVRLRILVDALGQPEQIELAGDAAGHGFDEAAVTAARRALWTPAQRGGEPVAEWIELRIEFRP